MEILKLTRLEHSGQGRGATHLKVLNKFREGEGVGREYCKKMGWEVTLKDNTFLKVESPNKYGFKMGAIVRQNI